MKKIIFSLILITAIIIANIYFWNPSKFEYEECKIENKTIECKYLEFSPPLKISSISGFGASYDSKEYPQWVQAIQFSSPGSKLNESFDQSFFVNYSEQRTNQIIEDWPGQVEALRNFAERLRETNKDNEEALWQSLGGLLFAKSDGKEYLLISKRNESGTLTKTKLLIKNEVKILDMEMEKVPAIISDATSHLDEIIAQLKSTESGFLKYDKDPFAWQIDWQAEN